MKRPPDLCLRISLLGPHKGNRMRLQLQDLRDTIQYIKTHWLEHRPHVTEKI